jgi:hypothetical protein
MNAPFPTRQNAESYLATQRYQGAAQLATFLDNDPRVLPTAPPAKPYEFPMHWRLLACLLTLVLFVLLLVAFLVLGEWPQRKPPVVPPHLQHLKN